MSRTTGELSTELLPLTSFALTMCLFQEATACGSMTGQQFWRDSYFKTKWTVRKILEPKSYQRWSIKTNTP